MVLDICLYGWLYAEGLFFFFYTALYFYVNERPARRTRAVCQLVTCAHAPSASWQ
jgi:hypothetical protein